MGLGRREGSRALCMELPAHLRLIQKRLSIHFKEKTLGFWKEILASWTVNHWLSEESLQRKYLGLGCNETQCEDMVRDGAWGTRHAEGVPNSGGR